MKNIVCIWVLIFITISFTSLSFCQETISSDILVMGNHPQYKPTLGSRDGYHINIMGYGAEHAFTKIGGESWASGGAGVAEFGSSGAILTNPACMDFQSTTISAELTGRIKTQTLYQYDFDGIFVPTYLSIGMKKGDWNLSTGYLNYYSYELSSKDMVETTPAFPEGTGNTLSYKKNITVHTLFVSSSHTAEQFRYGLTLGLDYLHISESSTRVSGHGFGVLAVAGLLATPSEELSIGLSAKYVMPIEYTIRSYNEDYLIRAAFPWQVELGFGIKILPMFHILTSVDFQNWLDVYPENVQNVLQFHLGTAFDVTQATTFRLGFFTQTDPSTVYAKYFNQYFLTGGFEVVDGNNKLSLSILDSHLFKREEVDGTSKDFYQTIISLGYSYRFE